MNSLDIDINSTRDAKHVYFIGIGGIGMSAIARFFIEQGTNVYGYDKTKTTLTKKLESEGMVIHYNDEPNLIPDNIDLVIYTPAIPADHKEMNFLKSKGFRLYKRSEILGWISRNFRTVAVAGTHGKTTTSSLVTHLLKQGGVDCTAFLGGIAVDFAGNYVGGKDNWVVVEADEYDRSFLQLFPQLTIVLSMDADHLDIYGEEATIKKTFSEFANQTETTGKVFYREGLQLLLKEGLSNASFGIEQGDYQARNVRVENGFFCFDFKGENIEIRNIKMALAGRHNIENACAAIAIALTIGVDAKTIGSALAGFKGIKRRFEIIYRDRSCVYIDDYAHHPTELNAAIGAARELFPREQIVGVFQPHLFSRTQDFASGFAAALDKLDQIFLLDIYPAREKPIPGVNSEMIATLMKNKNVVLCNLQNITGLLKKFNKGVMMTLGAGDIDTIVPILKHHFEQKK